MLLFILCTRLFNHLNLLRHCKASKRKTTTKLGTFVLLFLILFVPRVSRLLPLGPTPSGFFSVTMMASQFLLYIAIARYCRAIRFDVDNAIWLHSNIILLHITLTYSSFIFQQEQQHLEGLYPQEAQGMLLRL